MISAWADTQACCRTLVSCPRALALHDAILKAMPGQIQAPSLAETVTIAKDGRTFDFALRQNALRRSHKVRLVAPTGVVTVGGNYVMMLALPSTAMEGA